MASGWADLGRALAGGSDTTAAYQRGATRTAQLEALIADARIKQSEAAARNNLAGSLTKLGAPADLATVLLGGFDPTKISGYTGQMQEQGFRGDAVARALAGDWDGANANLFGVASGPQALATVEGQNLINNRFLAGGGGVSTTEQGQAGILADHARAAASRASAASSYATADSTRQRLGIAQQQFDLQRRGMWNPSGQAAGAGAAGTPKLTEQQSKDLVYLRRGSEANALLDDLAGNMTATGGQQGSRGVADVFLRGLPGGIGESSAVNALVSPERQQAEQAAREFLSAVLRKDTGAAITAQEFEIYGRTYLPQPGDSAATLKQKETARRVALDAIATGLGPERASMALRPAAAPPPARSLGDAFGGSAATPTARARNPQTGQWVVLRNGQWVPE